MSGGFSGKTAPGEKAYDKLGVEIKEKKEEANAAPNEAEADQFIGDMKKGSRRQPRKVTMTLVLLLVLLLALLLLVPC